jgi:hypothetical protein
MREKDSQIEVFAPNITKRAPWVMRKSKSSLQIMVLLWVFFWEEAVVFTRGRALWVMEIWAILGKKVFSVSYKSTYGHILKILEIWVLLNPFSLRKLSSLVFLGFQSVLC